MKEQLHLPLKTLVLACTLGAAMWALFVLLIVVLIGAST